MLPTSRRRVLAALDMPRRALWPELAVFAQQSLEGVRDVRDSARRQRARLCLAAFLAAASVLLQAQTYDLVILNGRVLDPESNLDAVRSVGINGGAIAAVSTERLTGRTTIDATGAIVVPGFIDLHAHGQAAEVYRLRASDGVTTALELEVGAADIDGWYRQREPGQAINFGVSVGHVPVRMAVLRDPGAFLPTGAGAHQAASPAEIAEIARRIEQGLDRGAVSIGAGFVYTPAASREELLAVFAVAGRRRAPIHVHTRRGLTGVEEALALASETTAPLHIVHVNSTSVGATPEVLAAIARARRQGLDVTTEAYPYTAGMTEIQSANLDEYVGAPAERLARLEWPATGERLNRESFEKYRKIGGPVVLHTNTDEMVKAAVTSPLTMIASDAYWENGIGHPRTTGTYSRMLGRFVREQQALTLMDAIRKMTLMPAQRLEARVPAMKTKGRLRTGADADIAVIDAATVIDRSTYREPGLAPVGIRHVLVNGVAVVSDGRAVDGVTPGRPVRAPAARP
jgi:N-acyl-D-aspartate/D-glutamate deacylase